MKNVRVLVFTVALLLWFIQSYSQSCDNGKQIAEKIFEKESYYNQAHTMPGSVFAIFKSIYNEVLTENGYAHWGPRYLELSGKKHEGIVHGTTQRTFVSNPSENGSVQVKIEKTGGKAKTAVQVCVYRKNGVLRSLPVYTFPNGHGQKTKNITVNGAKDKIIIVVVKNKSVGNKFKYKISAQ